MGTRIAHLSSVHRPLDSRIYFRECGSLAAAGYDVVLVAAVNEPPEERGVRIRVVPRESSRLRRGLVTAYRVYRAALDERAAICHIHDPELLPWALLLKLRGRRVVYDVHEDLPRQIMTKDWIPVRARRVVAAVAERVELFAARRFDLVVAATPTIAERFPAARTVLVQNFPIGDELVPAAATPLAERDRAVVYVGGLGLIRGVREMVVAVGEANEASSLRLILGGEFDTPELARSIAELDGWKHTDWRGWCTREQVRDAMSGARAGLALLHPAPNYLEAQSTKLFEYMAAGLPVIASDFPAWRRFVDDNACGLLVDPLDASAIAEAMTYLVDHPDEGEEMGRRGQEAVRTRYNWGREAATLVAAYERL